jgi:hypothetical protein
VSKPKVSVADSIVVESRFEAEIVDDCSCTFDSEFSTENAVGTPCTFSVMVEVPGVGGISVKLDGVLCDEDVANICGKAASVLLVVTFDAEVEVELSAELERRFGAEFVGDDWGKFDDEFVA